MKLPSELEYLKNVKMWVFILFFSLRPDVNCLVGDHWFQGQYLLTLKTKLHLTLKAALNKMPKKYFLKVNKQKRTYLKNKLLINMPLCNAGLKVGILQEAEQKFIDKLEYQGKKKENQHLTTVQVSQSWSGWIQWSTGFLLACEAMKPLEWARPPPDQNLDCRLAEVRGKYLCRSAEKRKNPKLKQNFWKR